MDPVLINAAAIRQLDLRPLDPCTQQPLDELIAEIGMGRSILEG